MRRVTAPVRLAALLFVLVLLPACGGSEPSAAGNYSANMIQTGKGLYQQTCFTCHGPDGRGLPNLGKDLTSSEFVRDSTDAELVGYVIRGRPTDDPLNTTGVAMPPRGGFAFLTEDDIQAIIAFIRVEMVQE